MTPPAGVTPWEDQFAAFCGEMAASLSFNRSVGQIFGLLYLSSEPISLGEISRRLRMSKGNASINLRTLESWGAVRSVPQNGSRQDHYQANTNLRELALRRLQEGLGRRLTLAEEALVRFAGDAEGLSPDVRKKIQNIKSMTGSARKALKVLPKLLALLPR